MSSCPAEVMEKPVATVPSPTAQELWKHYHKQADAPTENALVEKYLPLVASVMGRLAMTLPDHVDHDDLYSVGLIGLLQALRHYDPTCGTSFETYARVRVRGSMLDELRRMDWVPRTIHEQARKIKNTMAQLELRGLMVIPPYSVSPEDVRPYFRKLRALAFEIESRKLPNVSMVELSMGMSNDFEVAIEEGATIVRVGTAIFGERP